MIRKKDFKDKQFNETEKILDTELENGLKRELEKYYPSEEIIEIELLYTSHIPVDKDVKEHIKERLIDEHGFDYDDLRSIYKSDLTNNIIIELYVV